MEKNNVLDSYTWKQQNGSVVKLVDMRYDELQKAYTHTCDMLWNKPPCSIGRYQVKENIKKTIEACNAGLLLHYLLHVTPIDAFKTNRDVLNYIMSIKEKEGYSNTDSAANLFTGLSSEFKTVTINDLMDACLDRLTCINKKLISDKFILSQGIWLTKAEQKELTEYDDETHERRPYTEVIKERLFLPDVHLRIDPNGFSYEEFRALVHLMPMSKISSLTSKTLTLLRDKVLLLLEASNNNQINRWLTLKKQIEEVADYKHFMLKKKEY